MVVDAMGRPLGIGRQSDKAPRWLRRVLRRRDGGCRFPGCPVRRFVDAHHIWHWADGGPTDIELVLLGRFHHRLVHEVGYSIQVRGSGDFTVTRPGGRDVPPRPPVHEGDPAAPARSNRRLALNIDELTIIRDWNGKAPDYPLAVGALLDVSAETETKAAVWS